MIQRIQVAVAGRQAGEAGKEHESWLCSTEKTSIQVSVSIVVSVKRWSEGLLKHSSEEKHSQRRMPGSRSSRGRRNPKETQWTAGQAKERGEYVTFDLQTDWRSWSEQDQHWRVTRQEINPRTERQDRQAWTWTQGGRVTTNGSRRVAGSAGLRTLLLIALEQGEGEVLEAPSKGMEIWNLSHNQENHPGTWHFVTFNQWPS